MAFVAGGPGIVIPVSQIGKLHVFAKQQESQYKASGATVGDSFYRDRAKMRGLIPHILYSEGDHSECRMLL